MSSNDDKLDYKQKVFCDLFVESLDFHKSCKEAKVNHNVMLAYVYDKDSNISQYIKGRIDVFAMSNMFMTTDLIKYKLGQIILNGTAADAGYIIQAAKLLLGYEDSPDKTKEFMDLLEAIKTK